MLGCNRRCGVGKLSLRGVSPMSVRAGFTLIELLVVIAIIAITTSNSVSCVQSGSRQSAANIVSL